MENTIVNYLKNYFSNKPVNKAYLFGSFARNESNKDSDIDILLELRKEDNVDLFEFVRMKMDIEKLLEKEVDLVSSKGISRHIKPTIDKEKILIYER